MIRELGVHRGTYNEILPHAKILSAPFIKVIGKGIRILNNNIY